MGNRVLLEQLTDEQDGEELRGASWRVAVGVERAEGVQGERESDDRHRARSEKIRLGISG